MNPKSRAHLGQVAGKPHRTGFVRLTQRFARHKSILTTAVYSHPRMKTFIGQ
jgi:hypothetical protein